MNLNIIIGVVLGIVLFLLVILVWEKAVEFFSPEEKEKRRQLNEQIAEQHRLYDEEIARQEEALLASEGHDPDQRARMAGL